MVLLLLREVALDNCDALLGRFAKLEVKRDACVSETIVRASSVSESCISIPAVLMVRRDGDACFVATRDEVREFLGRGAITRGVVVSLGLLYHVSSKKKGLLGI